MAQDVFTGNAFQLLYIPPSGTLSLPRRQSVHTTSARLVRAEEGLCNRYQPSTHKLCAKNTCRNCPKKGLESHRERAKVGHGVVLRLEVTNRIRVALRLQLEAWDRLRSGDEEEEERKKRKRRKWACGVEKRRFDQKSPSTNKLGQSTSLLVVIWY